jgi:hypothetical protein
MSRPKTALAGLLALAVSCGPGTASAQEPATDSCVALQQLVGSWRVAGKPESPLRIRFSLTAGGTVLVESWSRIDQPHSLTLYHRGESGIVATHYCPQGNQPRLTSLPRTGDRALQFAFKDATDLDPAREAYLVALSFDWSKTGLLVRRESYRERGVDEASELILQREPQGMAVPRELPH